VSLTTLFLDAGGVLVTLWLGCGWAELARWVSDNSCSVTWAGQERRAWRTPR
jgi:hypothetical protein